MLSWSRGAVSQVRGNDGRSLKSSRKIGVSFERSEQGGLAECQPCGGATQELLLILWQCTPTQPALSHSEKQFGFVIASNVHYPLHCFQAFRLSSLLCFNAGLRMKAPVRLAQVIKCSAALLRCFIFPALIRLSRPWALLYSRDSLMYSAVNQSVSYSPLLADSIV